ncbi:energy transducer TonB family protein [Bradymonas sediminis]|nr:energy transducer TonB [Bradymonas sediminis]TDP73514.1 TonB family protein [Bradymonas sediminis]
MPTSTPPPKRIPPMTPRERRSGGAFWVALGVAALLHIPILAALPHLLRANQPSLTSALEDARDFRLSLVTEPTKTKEEERAELREKLRDELDGQFVSMEAPEVEETPDEARFLDQYASKAREETVRKQSSLPKTKSASAAKPTPTPRPEPARPAEARPAEARPVEQPPEQQPTPTPQKSSPSQDQRPPQAKPESAPTNPLKLAEDGAFKAEAPADFAPDTPARPLSPGDLFPTAQNTPAAIAGDGNFDYLADVTEGEKTLLNRKRSRYWSFMNRLKEAVAEEWSPMEEYRRRDPQGKVYGVKDRYTVLRVTLNGDGSLRTINVAKSSGLKFYDDEAVRAMRSAAPFMNPPEGLKDSDGLIHINFGLLLDVHRGTLRGFRINRR